jgi:hypothetical protein
VQIGEERVSRVDVRHTTQASLVPYSAQ